MEVVALAINDNADKVNNSFGSDVIYNVNDNNNGEVFYSDNSFTLVFSDVFEDDTYNGDMAEISGTLIKTAPRGDLAW